MSNLAADPRRLQEEIIKLKKQLEDKDWVSQKTSEGIRALYNELEEKNKALIREINEREKTAEKMKEAIEVKSEFISTVSHELRTPLTAIEEGIAIVLDGTTGAVNAEQRDFLEIAKRNVDRLARLINDVLDLQKLEAGRKKFNLQENDINEVVKEIEKTMASLIMEKRLNFMIKLQEKLPKVRFNKDKIAQVLTNLVNNAIKFTERGSITITTALEGDKAVRVSVQDTGCGIKIEDIPKLFHRFEQLAKGIARKTGGTGLGLAISKEIIVGHGGKIWAESEFDKGTTFHFVLPLEERTKRGQTPFAWKTTL